MEKRDFALMPQQRVELEKLGVVLCYLHGSVANGTAREDSDVDIAVLFKQEPSDPIEATGALLQALEGYMPGREKDVALLNEASPLFKQIVASTGKLLYARSPDDALRFELRAMHEYEDSRYIAHIGREIAKARAGV